MTTSTLPALNTTERAMIQQPGAYCRHDLSTDARLAAASSRLVALKLVTVDQHGLMRYTPAGKLIALRLKRAAIVAKYERAIGKIDALISAAEAGTAQTEVK